MSRLSENSNHDIPGYVEAAIEALDLVTPSPPRDGYFFYQSRHLPLPVIGEWPLRWEAQYDALEGLLLEVEGEWAIEIGGKFGIPAAIVWKGYTSFRATTCSGFAPSTRLLDALLTFNRLARGYVRRQLRKSARDGDETAQSWLDHMARREREARRALTDDPCSS